MQPLHKTLVLTCVTGLSATVAFSVTPRFLDSMKTQLSKATSVPDKLGCLYTLSYEYGLVNPRIGIRYGEECLKLAISTGNQFYQIHGNNGIANAYETLGKFDSALLFHTASYRAALGYKEPHRIALAISNMALCKKELGRYHEALDEFLRAYRILETLKRYNPRVHYFIAEMYIKTGQWAEARRHAMIGYQKSQAFGEPYLGYNMQIILSRCLLHAGKTDSARQMIETALMGLRRNIDRVSLAAGMQTRAELNLQSGQVLQAARDFEEELQLHLSSNNNKGRYLSRINLAYSLSQLPGFDKARIRGLLAQAEADAMQIRTNAEVLREGLSRAATVYERLGEWQTALASFKRFEQLRDSLTGVETMRQLHELQTRYETEKKERAIAGLTLSNRLKSAENNKLRLRNIAFLLSTVVLLLLVLLLYARYQRRVARIRAEKEKAIREAEENERLRLAKDIHDDLGSGLSKISFLSELLLRDTALTPDKSAHARSIADTTSGLVVNMRDLIWALNPSNISLSGLITRIREYASDYLEECQIALLSDLPPVSKPDHSPPITKESHRHLLMVVKESLNNTVKHAGASKVEIRVQLDAGAFCISIQDNGRGFDAVRDGGNGIHNMQNRIRSIGGSFEIRSIPGQGTGIFISVPLSAMRPVNTTNVVEP